MNAGILKIGKFIYAHRKGILIGVGIGTGIGAVIDGCRKTYKYAGDIIEDHKVAREEIENKKNDGELTEQEASKAVQKLYFNTGIRFAKTYSITFGLEAVSVGCFLGAAKAYRKEYSLLYTAFLNKCDEYDNYRENVRIEFGEEVDFRMANNLVHELDGGDVINIPDLDKKDKFNVARDYSNDGTFTFIFDDTFSDFGDREYNLYTINSTQDEINRLLSVKKALSIADILDVLGAPKEFIESSIMLKLEGFVFDEERSAEDGPQIILDISDNEFNPHIPEFKISIHHEGLIITDLYPDDYDFAHSIECAIKEQRESVKMRIKERSDVVLENNETLDDIFTEIDRKGEKLCQEA